MSARFVHRLTRRPLQSCGSRRGAVLLTVVVCLMVVTVLSVALARTLVMQHRQLQTRQHQLQALWLMQAAVDRAHAKLKDAGEGATPYVGETWEISAEQLGGEHAALVVIEAEPSSEDASRIVVDIDVQYPAQAVKSVRKNRRIVMSINQDNNELGEDL